MTLDDRAWKVLLSRIKGGKCTPFLGAGAAYGHIPLGTEVARTWSTEHGYPLSDATDLPKVAQFLATKFGDGMYPKEQLAQLIERSTVPNFHDEDEPHAVLARLPLPLYITTNYDDFMVRAIRECRTKLVETEICRWNDYVNKSASIFRDGYEPTAERPLVYHLHGQREIAESMVLTEDDFLDFLVRMSKPPELLPVPIQQRMGGTTLLFLGYSLNDFNFRVLFRSLVTYLQGSLSRAHVSVQLEPNRDNSSAEELRDVRAYLGDYFKQLNVSIYWGTCRNFVRELSQRWRESSAG